MQSKPKVNSIITSRLDEERNVLVFTVLGHGEVELDLNKISAANLARAAIHGFNQRIPDSAAIGQADADGNPIPAAERTRIKYERMNELCAFYESGTEEWSRKPQGGEGSGKSLTIEGIARAKGGTYEEAETIVEQHMAMHKLDRKAALLSIRKQSAKTRAAMEEIRQERAAKGLEGIPSAADILDGLTDSPKK